MSGATTTDFVWVDPAFPLEGDAFSFVRGRQGDVFRDVPGRKTLRFEFAGRSYFLKHHLGVGWLEIFKNLLSLRLPILGAETEWRAIEALQRCGVPTMRAVAFGRRGASPASMESFIITEELTPVVSLEDLVKQQPLRHSLKRALIREVALMTRRMHRAGINHRDLYLCHFLLDTGRLQGGELRLSLIDLHRAQLRQAVPRRWRDKDLASLYFSSLEARLTNRDKILFLKAYFDKPLRSIVADEAASLAWLEAEAARLRAKFERKYSPAR